MNIDKLLNQIKKEEQRNTNFLHLTANENQMSNTARMFLGSKINERYYMGGGTRDAIMDNGHFTALGFPGVEHLVYEAMEAAKQMLSAVEVNLNVLSGVHAMICAILSTTEPNDTIMTVPLEAGGHFATKGIVERAGRKHVFADYNFATLTFDTNKIASKFSKLRIRALYLDISYYLNPVNLKGIRDAIGKNPIIIFDASHTMGLIMGQQFQSPLLEGANVICANTHKTLPGPHKGMIAFRDMDLAEKANMIMNHGLYSSTHVSHIIALAITILEMKKYGKKFAKQIILNSNAIGTAFDNLGYEVKRANTGRYSENHQCHVFIDTKGNYMKLYKYLKDNNIATNFEGMEFNNNRWFMRIGTAEVTRRGMNEPEMTQIARLMDQALQGKNVLHEVIALNSMYTKIHYSFDQRGFIQKCTDLLL